MAKNKIKCDVNPQDFIKVKGFTDEGPGDPANVNLFVVMDDQTSAVEFQSPKKVRKLIEALERASEKAFGPEVE